LRVNDAPVALRYEYVPYPPQPLIGLAHVAGDLRGYAGATVELRFATVPPGFGSGLDRISFSPEIVPEASSWLLIGSGAVGLLVGQRWFRGVSQASN
jgi:hypothetical protein